MTEQHRYTVLLYAIAYVIPSYAYVIVTYTVSSWRFAYELY